MEPNINYSFYDDFKYPPMELEFFRDRFVSMMKEIKGIDDLLEIEELASLAFLMFIAGWIGCRKHHNISKEIREWE